MCTYGTGSFFCFLDPIISKGDFILWCTLISTLYIIIGSVRYLISRISNKKTASLKTIILYPLSMVLLALSRTLFVIGSLINMLLQNIVKILRFLGYWKHSFVLYPNVVTRKKQKEIIEQHYFDIDLEKKRIEKIEKMDKLFADSPSMKKFQEVKDRLSYVHNIRN